MYLCSKCRMPLTDFDVCFHKKIFSARQNQNCECFDCVSKKGQVGGTLEAYNRGKKSLKAHVMATIFMLLIVASFALFALFVFIKGDSAVFEHYYIYIIVMGVSLVSSFGIIINAIIVVHSLGISMADTLEGTGKYSYKSTIQKDGSIITEKVEEVTGSTGLFGLLCNVFLFFTFILWCIPHMFYVIAKNKQRYKDNQKLIDAYDFASSQVPKNNISAISYSGYEDLNKCYQKDYKRISDQYFYLEGEELKKTLESCKLSKELSLTLQGKTYIVMHWMKSQNLDALFLLDTSRGKAVVRVLLNGYFAYSGNEKVSEIWDGEWIVNQLNRYAERDSLPRYYMTRYNIH